MQTIRTISNIAYNSAPFFQNVIESLVTRGIIDWAYWIHHEPDVDERKPHIHFVLKPSKRLNTQDLAKAFHEFDPTHPDKPLGCTSKWFNTNSLDDWLLYAVHDASYLASKGQVRNLHYQYEDLCATDPDALRYDWNSIDRTKFERLRWLADAVENHIPFAQLVQDGIVPIAQRQQFQFQYEALMKLKLDERSGRIKAHKEELDIETGEILAPVQKFVQDDDIEF